MAAAVSAKYGAVEAERGEFHPGEPVFVIRGSDPVAGDAIRAYKRAARRAGVDKAELEDLDAVAAYVEGWQQFNADKVNGDRAAG